MDIDGMRLKDIPGGIAAKNLAIDWNSVEEEQ